MSTCHCGTNMTEVAQVAAVVAHNVDDVTNENEREGDFEDKTKEKKSHREDKKLKKNDKGSKTQVNSVEHKEKNTAHKKKDGSDVVNGLAQATEKEHAEPDTQENQNISDLALKKEVSQKFKTKV